MTIYRRISKVAGAATFEISDLQGRLHSDGRLLSEGAYFRVVIFSIGQVLTTTVHFAQRFKVLFYYSGYPW